MQGRLIVFEGTDGSGKATQSTLLCDELTRRNISFRKLEFPRYQEESSALIRLYLGGAFGDKPDDVNAYAASVFYSVDPLRLLQAGLGRVLRKRRAAHRPTDTPPATPSIRRPSCPPGAA